MGGILLWPGDRLTQLHPRHTEPETGGGAHAQLLTRATGLDAERQMLAPSAPDTPCSHVSGLREAVGT